MWRLHRIVALVVSTATLLGGAPAWSQAWLEGVTVSFQDLTPTVVFDPSTGTTRYLQCGEPISGTLLLTNLSSQEIWYSHLEVGLAFVFHLEPYAQSFPQPFRTIVPGEVHSYPFSLQTTKVSGSVALQGTVSFPEYALDSHDFIERAYSRSVSETYTLECGSGGGTGQRESLIDAWNRLSRAAKALWAGFAAWVMWLLWRHLQIAKMETAVAELFKKGLPVRSEGLKGGQGLKPRIVQLPGGPLCFQVPLDVCTDGTGPAADGEGLVSDGSGTSDERTSMGYINADENSYIVLTGDNWYKRFGIDKGDVALVMYRGRMTGAVFAEVGPSEKLGEASVKALESVGGITRRPNGAVVNAATPHAATVIVLPGSGDQLPRGRPKYVPEGTPVEKTNFPTNAEINAVAFAHARRLGLIASQ